MGKLFEELKRRKVFRVGTVYAVVAWLLIEVTSTILPTFEAPEWVIQTITLLLIIGFPIAVILAWAYEVTPEGIKKDRVAQEITPTATSNDRNLIYLVLILVVMVAGLQLSDQFFDRQSDSTIVNQDSSSQVVRSRIPLGELMPMRIFGASFPIRTLLNLSADGTRFSYTSST